ncbi:uncharacterized protein LOC123667240 [Melitaea cinxia]|uniref:uncharacterized protein LOC123667240 n=1 Tax=Melitaea cinxia TaxID=113334 RepID=UPI001E273282|nr:uncharacterized protein LOC123667240 [Melitaea cinxia]
MFMGDFNTCLLKNDYKSVKLNSLITSSNLNILPLSATHCLPNRNPSLLDLIIVSSTDLVEKYGQCNALAFSYHDLIYLSYRLRPPKPKSRILMLRNFDGIDHDRLHEDAVKIDWSVVLTADTIDERVTTFNSLLTNLYNIHAPIRPVRIKHLPAPWLTDDIRAIQHRRNIAKAKYRANPNEKNLEKYKKIRNRCNTICRDKRRHHIHKHVTEEVDPSKVWKFLQTLGVGKAKQNIESNKLDFNQLNQHFLTSDSIDGSIKLNTLSQISATSTPTFPSFTFSQFTVRDVKRNILEISSNSVGADSISRKMIMLIIDVVAPIITSIFNFSIQSCSLPSLWKDAQIIPLPKKLNPSNYSDYRPIAILPFLSKVLERLIYKQMTPFLLQHNLFNPMQSGFRHGHSTTTALVKITDDIRLGMDNQLVTVLILLDFKEQQRRISNWLDDENNDVYGGSNDEDGEGGIYPDKRSKHNTDSEQKCEDESTE